MMRILSPHVMIERVLSLQAFKKTTTCETSTAYTGGSNGLLI